MNTERVQVLKNLRDAEAALVKAIKATGPDDPGFKPLLDAKARLEDAEEKVMADMVEDSADDLAGAAKRLKNAVDQIKAADDELSGLADKIQDAAQAVSILGELMALAAKLGVV